MSEIAQDVEWFTCGECGQQLDDITNWPVHPCFKKVVNQEEHEYLKNDYNQIFLYPKESIVRVEADDCMNGTSQGTETVAAEDAKLSSLEEKIIISVRGRSTLWKPDQSKKFPAQALQEWENVCEDIGQPRSNRDEVKKLWTALRSKYSKAHKTFIKPRPSGAAAKPKKSRFIFYDEMNFLAHTIDVPETSSTLSASGSSNSHNNLPSKPDPPGVHTAVKEKKTPRQEYEELCHLNRQIPLPTAEERAEERKEHQTHKKNSSMRQQMIEILQYNDKPQTPDGVDGFCVQVAEVLRTIKDPLTRNEVQNASMNFILTKVREVGEYRV